jgi:hypothetical protein
MVLIMTKMEKHPWDLKISYTEAAVSKILNGSLESLFIVVTIQRY